MINSRKIEDLTPTAQEKCKEFVNKCSEQNIKVKIIQTLRDAEYQNYIYKSGRTRPGKILTQKDGKKNPSKHQSGNAWDAVPLDEKGDIIWSDSKIYKKMADIAVGMGLRAGYYFSFVDMNHFEVK